jgi:osmotically-inducible protein OsmY
MYTSTWKISDNEIAGEVTSAFKWNWQIPSNKVKVTVTDGWLTMEGDVQWNFQREAAIRSVNNLIGVKGVTNNITIDAETQDEIEKRKIEMALVGDWSIDDEGIQVVVAGPNVILNGTVPTLYQRMEAERLARNEPGIRTVENELVIEYDE